MVDRLAGDEDLYVVRLAAWFHDAVYDLPERELTNEEASARLSLRELGRAGFEQEDLTQVARLVRLTATHAAGRPRPGGRAALRRRPGRARRPAGALRRLRRGGPRRVRGRPGGGVPGRRGSPCWSPWRTGEIFRSGKAQSLKAAARANLDRELWSLARPARDRAAGRRGPCARLAQVSSPEQPRVPSTGTVLAREPGWWRSAVVYQIYPRSFADSNGDGIGDIPGITAKVDYLAALGVDVVWLSPVYALAAGRQRLRHQRLRGHRPDVRHAGRPRRADRGLHARGIKLVMDLVVNHTSDEHAWFAGVAGPGLAEARLVLVAAGAGRASRPAPRGPSPPTGRPSSPAPPGSSTSGAGSTTCTCSAGSSPTSTGRTRRSARRSTR